MQMWNAIVTTVVCLCALMLTLPGSQAASGVQLHGQPLPQRHLTQQDASVLVYKSLEETTSWTRLPRFGLDPYTDPYFPDFFFFEVSYDNPVGSVVLGHYAVNPITGDVWEAIGCKRLRAKSVRPLQAQFRARSGLSKELLAKQRGRAPCGK